MNEQEAKKFFEQVRGKKIRHKGWEKEDYIIPQSLDYVDDSIKAYSYDCLYDFPVPLNNYFICDGFEIWEFYDTEILANKTIEMIKESIIYNEKKHKVDGGLRHNKGKLQINEVPTSLMYAVAKVFEFGASKYAKHNWRKGMAWSTVYDCLQRHITSFWDGEDCDEESQLNHLYHAAANIAILIEYLETHKDKDDRYKGAINGKKTFYKK